MFRVSTLSLRAVSQAVRGSIPRRQFHISMPFSQSTDSSSPIFVNFAIPHHKKSLKFEAKDGETLYDLCLREPDLSEHFECACGGIAACSTCHVYVEDAFMGKIGEPEEFEKDMIDIAYAPQANSRLGCQIQLNRSIDGIVLTVPSGSKNHF